MCALNHKKNVNDTILRGNEAIREAAPQHNLLWCLMIIKTIKQYCPVLNIGISYSK